MTAVHLLADKPRTFMRFCLDRAKKAMRAQPMYPRRADASPEGTAATSNESMEKIVESGRLMTGADHLDGRQFGGPTGPKE